jgi:hypothetical protein
MTEDQLAALDKALDAEGVTHTTTTHAELREAETASHNAKALQMWESFTDNEKTLVRFGMFPAHAMAVVEAEGFDSHKIVCGLMDAAKADGGMRA